MSLRNFVPLILMLACAGCALTRERAAAIATAELARRKLPLPPTYTVDVIEGFAQFEFEPRYTIFVVQFRVPNRKEPLYSIQVDPKRGVE